MAIEAVEANVPPAAIIGLPSAAKIDVPFLLRSIIAETPDATVRVIKFAYLHCPVLWIGKGVLKIVVAPDIVAFTSHATTTGMPFIDAPDTLSSVSTLSLRIEAVEEIANPFANTLPTEALDMPIRL